MTRRRGWVLMGLVMVVLVILGMFVEASPGTITVHSLDIVATGAGEPLQLIDLDIPTLTPGETEDLKVKLNIRGGKFTFDDLDLIAKITVGNVSRTITQNAGTTNNDLYLNVPSPITERFTDDTSPTGIIEEGDDILYTIPLSLDNDANLEQNYEIDLTIKRGNREVIRIGNIYPLAGEPLQITEVVAPSLYPGESGDLKVTVKNNGHAPVKASILVSDRGDDPAVIEIGGENGVSKTIDKGGSAIWTIPLTIGPDQPVSGYNVKIEVRRD